MNDKDRHLRSSQGTTTTKHYIYEPSPSTFDYTLPRPPALGEETAQQISEWPASTCSSISQMDRSSKHQYYYQKSSSPLPKFEFEDVEAKQPQPLLQATSACSSSSPPACLGWAESLRKLLQDSEGVQLFMRYLDGEGPQHANALHFWLACEGLKNPNQSDRVQRLVKLIYKTYFLKAALPIDDELRREVTGKMKSPQCLEPPVTLFDEAQAQVERLINNTTYPNFLKSDMYLQYLQSVQNPSSGSEDFSCESSASISPVSTAKDLPGLTGMASTLPTLHEDREFNPPAALLTTPGTGNMSTGYQTPTYFGGPRLTKDMLLRSQKHRALDIRPKSETYAGMLYRGSGAHAAYNSYNPVSRQDSEMQSLSSHSDARTESDNLSISESIMDGRTSGRSRHRTSMEARHARESAALNKETDMMHTFIPRTQRLDMCKCPPMDCQKHAAILREKLEILKKKSDSVELLERRLKESESIDSLDDKLRPDIVPPQPRDLEPADIQGKLQFPDDNVQDILDEHVSRVFGDHSLVTSPPPVMSPRSLSPRRYAQSGYAARPGRTRKDRDGFSTFSGDSGNIHDFADGSEHKLVMVKSKSTPEYGHHHHHHLAESEQRPLFGCRTAAGSRRNASSSSRKTLADLTDSGVSVVSDSASLGGGGGSGVGGVMVKDSRVMNWLMDADARRGTGTRHAQSEMAYTQQGGKKGQQLQQQPHRKGWGSRSNSLERNSISAVVGGGTGSGGLGPAQPFVADPSMPPMPPPNTAIQLEEARRRLLEDDLRTRSRQRPSNKYHTSAEMLPSSQSTLRKSMGSGGRIQPPVRPTILNDDVTTVVFSFCDEQFPYRTKIPGGQITLRQFKDYLPKKGNYRFFFKTICDDEVTHMEVSNDTEILPLWEGKVMAQVKPTD